MKIAIVHDYLVNRGGAERVVLALHRVWPDAPIYTSLYHPSATYPDFRGADVRPSSLQRLSRDPRGFRRLLPLFPAAFARMDFREYDVVISSSAGFAHTVHVPPSACHLVYSYSPPRFLYDDRYDLGSVAPSLAHPVVRVVLRRLRARDRRAAARPHRYVAVSKLAAERIERIYGRTATVLYPPVETKRFSRARTTGDYYLLVGRLLPHRNTRLAIEAFTRAGHPLVVAGDGPARAALERIAGPNVEFRGVVPDEELVTLYARCRGAVVPGEEDLGLVPLEANASGRPAICYGAGGALETVVDGVTGILFSEPTVESLVAAVRRAEQTAFDPQALRDHAEQFSEAAFARRIREIVEHRHSSCPECARTGTARAPAR